MSVDPTISEETCAPLRARGANQPPAPAGSTNAPEQATTPCPKNGEGCVSLDSETEVEGKSDTEAEGKSGTETEGEKLTTDCNDAHEYVDRCTYTLT